MNITQIDDKGNEQMTHRLSGGIQTERDLILSLIMNISAAVSNKRERVNIMIETSGIKHENLRDIALALDDCR